MNYEPPPWITDFADPKALDDYEKTLEVLEIHNAVILEEMTQEEFEEHNKIGVELFITYTHFTIYMARLIKEHGNPKEIKDYQKALEQMSELITASREEPHN